LLDQGPILGHIIESLENRLKWNSVVPSELFGSARIGTVDGLVDDCRSNPPPLEK
jgi:hypothetical protein